MPLFLLHPINKTTLFLLYIYMIVLESSNSAQTFSFIPRSYTSGTTYNVIITNESTNTQVSNFTTTSFVAQDYYYNYTNTFSLIQDVMYLLEIKDGANTIYKDKIFCTNQAVSAYSVNNGTYTEHNIDDDFIIL